MSTANHPQTDGQTEIMVKTLKAMLRHFVNYKQDNWHDLLPTMEIAYNHSVNSSTGFSPFELDLGFNPRLPHDLVNSANPSNSEEVGRFIEKLTADTATAMEALQRAQQDQARYYNARHRSQVFKEGQMVWLSSKHITPPWERRRKTKKLRPKWLGPFKITKKMNENSYELELPTGMKIHNVINASYLKPHEDSHSALRKPAKKPRPHSVDKDGEHHEIEDILDHKFQPRTHEPRYFVRWKYFGPDHNEWVERERFFPNAVKILREYEAENDMDHSDLSTEKEKDKLSDDSESDHSGTTNSDGDE
jgi:hypothetical protein